MFGYPEAIGLSSFFIGASSAIVVAIKTKSRANGNGLDINKVMFKDTCDAKHAGIESRLSSIDDKLNILLQRDTGRS